MDIRRECECVNRTSLVARLLYNICIKTTYGRHDVDRGSERLAIRCPSLASGRKGTGRRFQTCPRQYPTSSNSSTLLPGVFLDAFQHLPPFLPTPWLCRHSPFDFIFGSCQRLALIRCIHSAVHRCSRTPSANLQYASHRCRVQLRCIEQGRTQRCWWAWNLLHVAGDTLNTREPHGDLYGASSKAGGMSGLLT